MEPIEIKILMMRAGVTQEFIGKKLGHHRAYVNQIITGRRKNKRIRRAIARAVKRPIGELWPERIRPRI